MGNYYDCCPICHGSGCPIRIGYYYRYVIDISSKFFQQIPIIRFKCRRKGPKKANALTFSLLPDTLIPYFRYTIDSFIKAIELFLASSISIALQHIYDAIQEALNTSEKTILRLYNLFRQSCIKLMNFFRSNYNKSPPNFYSYDEGQILEFMQAFNNGEFDSGANALAVYYYQSKGAYIKNARFLFGTASQFQS